MLILSFKQSKIWSKYEENLLKSQPQTLGTRWKICDLRLIEWNGSNSIQRRKKKHKSKEPPQLDRKQSLIVVLVLSLFIKQNLIVRVAVNRASLGLRSKTASTQHNIAKFNTFQFKMKSDKG